MTSYDTSNQMDNDYYQPDQTSGEPTARSYDQNGYNNNNNQNDFNNENGFQEQTNQPVTHDNRSPATGFMKYNENETLNPISNQKAGYLSNRSGNTNRENKLNGDYVDAHQNKAQNLSLEYGKTIRLLRNGDEFYRGHKFVINSRKYRYFDVFMDDISNDLNANFGAIRKIHTPTHGHRIKSLDQMEDGKTYVAAGNSRFIKINYNDVLEGKRPTPNNRLPAIARTDYSNYVVNQYESPQNALIYVYRNGDANHPPSKILLYKGTMNSFDAVLDQISSKVKLPNGAVFKLFNMEGELVRGAADILSGNSYVAAHKDRFKKVDYSSAGDFNTSPRYVRKTGYIRKTNSQPSYASTASSKTNSSFGHNKNNGWRKENSNPNSLPNNLPPVRITKTRVNVNVDKDENGIYKAIPNRSGNADEIEEAPNMYVDMPVDYKKTEQIDDEFMNDRKAALNNQKTPISPIAQNQISKPNSKPPPHPIKNPTPTPMKQRSPSPAPITRRSPSPAPEQITQRSPSPAPAQTPSTMKVASPDILPAPDTSRDLPSEAKKLNVVSDRIDSPLNDAKSSVDNQNMDLDLGNNETARVESPKIATARSEAIEKEEIPYNVAQNETVEDEVVENDVKSEVIHDQVIQNEIVQNEVTESVYRSSTPPEEREKALIDESVIENGNQQITVKKFNTEADDGHKSNVHEEENIKPSSIGKAEPETQPQEDNMPSTEAAPENTEATSEETLKQQSKISIMDHPAFVGDDNDASKQNE